MVKLALLICFVFVNAICCADDDDGSDGGFDWKRATLEKAIKKGTAGVLSGITINYREGELNAGNGHTEISLVASWCLRGKTQCHEEEIFGAVTDGEGHSPFVKNGKLIWKLVAEYWNDDDTVKHSTETLCWKFDVKKEALIEQKACKI